MSLFWDRREAECAWMDAKAISLPDRFKLQLLRTYSYEKNAPVFGVRVIHEGETAERFGLLVDEVRDAVLACRDEIIARAVAHLT